MIHYKTDNKLTHLIIFDHESIFVFRLSDRKFFRKIDQRVKTLISFTNEINYAICSGSLGEIGGLYYYNLEDIIKSVDEDKDIKTLLFKSIDLGSNTSLFFSQEENRIGYFNGLSHVTIVPMLHTNRLKFIGINN